MPPWIRPGLCMLGLACAPAWANRPLNTDTADTIPHHRCQFEPYAASTRAEGEPRQLDKIVQLNCGVTPHTQLGVVYDRSSAGDETESALALAGKTNLRELTETQTGVAVAYGLSSLRSAGRSSWRQDGSFVNAIATRRLAPELLGHLNLGWSRSRLASQDSTTWGEALEWSLSPRVVLSGEAFGTDRTSGWWSAGLWWALGDSFSVNVSYGAQRSGPRARQATAGFNWEF